MKQKQMTNDELAFEIAKKTRRSSDPKFIEWIKQRLEIGYQFDYFLYSRAYGIYKSLFNNYDHFTIITGMERSGKSTLGVQYCSVISPTFSLKNICFDLAQVVKVARESNKGDSIMIDEGALVLFSRDSMAEANRKLNKLFSIFGMKSLNVVVNIPNFFMIDSYIRDHRVKTLIYVTERGKYNAYVGDAIKKISKEGAKEKKIRGIKVKDTDYWQGYFTKGFPEINDINEQTYENHKARNVDKYMDDILKTDLSSNYYTTREVSKICKVSQDTIITWIKNKKVKGKKIGGQWRINKADIDKMA